MNLSSDRRDDISKKMDKEKVAALKNIKDVFETADDGDNMLTKEEFLTALKKQGVVKALHAVDIDFAGAETLFDILDYDGSGSIDVTEFQQGCLRARGSAKATDLLAAQCDLWRTQNHAKQLISSTMTEFERRFRGVDEDMAAIKRLVGMGVGSGREPVSPQTGKPRTRTLVMPTGFGKKRGQAAGASE